MKKFFAFWLVMAFVLSVVIQPTHAANVIKPGAKCAPAGITKIINALRYTCVVKNKKLQWSSGIAIKTGKSKPSVMAAQPTPNATSSAVAKSSERPAQVLDGLNFKDDMIYGLEKSLLTRRADSGTYFSTDSRAAGSFSEIRQKAYAELNPQLKSIDHPNIEFIYDIRSSFPAALVEHSKRELDEAAAMWNDFFESKIKVRVSLVTEKDREYIKGNRWLNINLPNTFSRFDAKKERPFISGGGGYWEHDEGWIGEIYLATASYLDLSYINFEWPQVAKHEFVHVLQDYAMFQKKRTRPNDEREYNKLQPLHFREGGANTISYLTGFRNLGWSSDAMNWLVWQRGGNNRNWIEIKSIEDAIRMMEGTEQREPEQAFEMSYAIGALMYEWVVGTYGLEGFKKLLKQLATAPSFDVALQNSIGISQRELYKKSAPYVYSVFKGVEPYRSW